MTRRDEKQWRRIRGAQELRAREREALGLTDQQPFSDTASSKEIVCHRHGIYGWDEQADRARELVGDHTSALPQTRIYLTCERNFLYAHSNFVKPTCEHSTKLLTNQRRSLEEIVANLVATQADFSSPYFAHDLRRAISREITFFINEDILDSTAGGAIDVADLGRAFVISGDRLLPLEAWQKQKEGQVQPPPRSNPWLSGSFYLVALLSVLITFRVITGELDAYAIPLVIVAGLLSVSIIGAFTLRNQNLLGEQPFLKLMALSFRHMPLLRNLLPGDSKEPGQHQ